MSKRLKAKIRKALERKGFQWNQGTITKHRKERRFLFHPHQGETILINLNTSS